MTLEIGGRGRGAPWVALLFVAAAHGVALAFILKVPPRAIAIDPPRVLSVSWVVADVAPATKAVPQPVKRPLPLPAAVPARPQIQTMAPADVPAETIVTSADVAQQQIPATAAAARLDSTAPAAVAAIPSAPPTSSAAPAAENLPVSAPRFNADYLSNPAPVYPPESRTRGEQGKVLLRVLVSQAGAAEEVALRLGSGHERLDQAALDAVRHWKFVPARKGTEAVAAWVVVPILFTLWR